MKLIIALFAALICQVQASDDDSVMTEFLQGMEAGFFLRSNPEGYKDYECPELVVNNEDSKKLQELFGPVKMILGLLKNKEIERLWETVTLYINTLVTLEAAHVGYAGSEFCSGMLFGIHGSRLLIHMGKELYNL